MATALHPHCSTCVNLCCVEPARPGDSCEVTSCPLKCGASFHGCKGAEHRLLCPLEAVPCPSQCYGCPVSMPRARVAQHLSVCPASVVRCRHTHFPNIRPTAGLHTHNTLAADTLSDGHSSDTHTASDAYTSLTQTPCSEVSSMQSQTANLHAVQPELNGKNVPEESLHKRSKSIPNGDNLVLAETVVNGPSDDLKQSDTEVASTRKPITSAAVVMDINVNQSDRPETHKGGSEGGCRGTSADVTPEAPQSTSEADASWEKECLISHPIGDLDAFPPCYDREGRLQLLQRFLPQDLSVRLAGSPANCSGGPTEPADQAMEVRLPTANCLGSVEVGTAAVAPENVEVSQAESCCAHVPSSSTTTTTTIDAAMSLSQTPPATGTNTGSSGSSSPHQGYGEEPAGTTVCGRLFRRDEFLWHSRNVHADLDLLEHACPLAAYGCPVVQRQLSAPQNARLVYDARLGALGLLPAPPAVDPDAQGLDRLSALPVELQRHLLGYLDSFSLNQLAMTSSRMREACAGLLRVRGMVILRWARCCRDNNSSNDDNNNKNGDTCGDGDGGGRVCRWKVQDKVWRFSTSFSHVESWDVVDAPSLSNHLQGCQWNQVERPLEARALPCMSGHADLGSGLMELGNTSARRGTLGWFCSFVSRPSR